MMPRCIFFSSMIPSSLDSSLSECRIKKVSQNALSHCLYTHATLVGEEDKDLLGWVLLVGGEEVQLTSTLAAPQSARCGK